MSIVQFWLVTIRVCHPVIQPEAINTVYIIPTIMDVDLEAQKV